jgi:hypothetical protein
MKKLNYLVSFSFIAIMAVLTISCNNEKEDKSLSQDVVIESNEIFTRSNNSKVESEAYHYKNLAVFTDGKADIDINKLAELAGKKVSLVVIYDAVAPWAKVFDSGKFSETGNDNLNDLMSSFELSIVEQFSVDENNEGIVLEGNSILNEPVEAARKLSLIDYVLMVEIKEVPTEDMMEETAENE